jgi:hypothetical protein
VQRSGVLVCRVRARRRNAVKKLVFSYILFALVGGAAVWAG